MNQPWLRVGSEDARLYRCPLILSFNLFELGFLPHSYIHTWSFNVFTSWKSLEQLILVGTCYVSASDRSASDCLRLGLCIYWKRWRSMAAFRPAEPEMMRGSDGGAIDVDLTKWRYLNISKDCWSSNNRLFFFFGLEDLTELKTTQPMYSAGFWLWCDVQWFLGCHWGAKKCWPDRKIPGQLI